MAITAVLVALTPARSPGPTGSALLFVALFALLLAGLAAGWRWTARHRDTVLAAARRAWTGFSSARAVRRVGDRYPRLWPFLRARLSPESYVGLHLTLGFLLSVAALVFFGTVAEDIADREELAVFDADVAGWFRVLRTPVGTRIFHAVSLSGSPGFMTALTLGVGAVLLARRERLLLYGWLVALAGGGLLDWALKHVFRRTRPVGAEAFLVGHSWSFPSGHSMGSLIGYGMLAYLIALHLRSWRQQVWTFAAALGLVLAIGISRLYLGVHYFTDVVGGFAAGAVWLSACVSGVEVLRRRRLSDGGARSSPLSDGYA